MSLSKNITIEDFINNPYYLGDTVKDIYPYWKEQLIKINNDDYRIDVFHGSDCNGKTSIQLIQLLYDYCKLQLLDNPNEDLNVFGNIDLVIVHDLKGIADHFKRVILKGIEESDFIKDLKQAGKFKDNIKLHSYCFNELERLYSLNVTTILIDDLHINVDILAALLDCYKHIARKPECKNAGHILVNSSTNLQNIKLFPYDPNSKAYYLKTSLKDIREYNELTNIFRSNCQNFIKNTVGLTKEDAIKYIESSEFDTNPINIKFIKAIFDKGIKMTE
jgi:hypothetical protein